MNSVSNVVVEGNVMESNLHKGIWLAYAKNNFFTYNKLLNNVASMHPLAKASGFLGSATAVEPETVYTSYD